MFDVLVARATMATIEIPRANYTIVSDVVFLPYHSSFTKNLRPKSKFGSAYLILQPFSVTLP